jgi:hypothetical protein
MAAFLDVCRFSPTAGGTTDFTYSAAVQGYQSPTAAGVTNGRLYKYRAENANLLEWEVGEGSYNTGTGVLARTTVLFNSAGGTSKISFTLAPQVAIVALKEDLISVEEANAFSVAQRKQARSNISALLRGSKPFGLTLSVVGGTGNFAIAAGEAADSTGSDLMMLATGFTKTTGAWAVGTGTGSLDTGTIAPSTWYHVYEIKRPDTGVVDICISQNPSAPSFVSLIPANYTLYRRIGSMLTDGSSFWTKFFQLGSVFMWDVSVQNVNAGTIGTTAVSQVLTTPLGVRVEASLHVLVLSSTVGVGILVSSLDISDQAAVSGLPNVGFTQVSGGVALTGLREYTNLSSSVRMRASQPSTTYTVWSIGWDDLGLAQGI